MKILIEGYAYDPEVVKNALPENRLFLTKDKIKIEYVGYYHNAQCTAAGNDDFVFFLPKVVLNGENRVFAPIGNPHGGFAPEEIVDPEQVRTNDGRQLTEEERDFLYGFSVWIYRALAHYLETHSETDVVWYCHDRQSGAFKRRYVTSTFLDVILALIRFNRENRDYFLFKVKEKHAGLNRISWARTIARTPAVIGSDGPVYLQPINKKRTVDFDEELLVIYYSILAYIRRQYGFRIQGGMGYDLISGDRFRRYLDGYGVARLRRIRYKYFSDRDLMLWELCFAFFDRAHQANIANGGENYLLAKDFEQVFEGMIDELLGDEDLAKYKELSDGKELDHLYVDDSLTRTDNWRTLCIADSKYYKIGNALEEKSIAKQFTYARDMLQLDLDLFLYDKDEVSPKIAREREHFTERHVDLLRDEITEGYDILPNFFISATMNEEFDYDKDGLVARDQDMGGEHHSIHFENRLFDRDTLLLSHFDVNFLCVVKLYAQNDESARRAWRAHARKLFRDEIRGIISARYELHALMPHEGVDAAQFFRENFKYTAGKVYAPYGRGKGDPVYALALQNPSYIFKDERLTPEGRNKQIDRVRKENASIRELVKTSFYVVENVPFGHDPRPDLESLAMSHPVVHAPVADVVTGVQVVSKVAGPLTRAIRETGLCPCPEGQCPNAEAVRVLVVPYTQGANLFHVVAGSDPRNLDKSELPPSFADVVFPESRCWVWQVTGRREN